MNSTEVKFGVIIPDRGDRPRFTQQCLSMLERQTLPRFDCVELVNYPPHSNKIDITERYRNGYDRLRNKNIDLIFFIENDDWYHPDYFKTMIEEWMVAGRPSMIGLNSTTFYHIGLHAAFNIKHFTRSSMMSTAIKPDLDVHWPPDSEPYTDVHLWNTIGKKNSHIFQPNQTICLGIKHGTGLCGGGNHTTRLDQFQIKDHDLSFLKKIMEKDPKSFDFYSNFSVI